VQLLLVELALLVVTGAATVGSTLGVTGATTLSSTLDVTGAASLASTLDVSGAVAIDGATTLSSTLGVTGAATLSSTLDVTGAITGLSYSNSSDYRIKTDVVDLSTTGYSIDNLRPVYYHNTQSNSSDMGLIAHETAEIFPFLVTGEKDGEQLQSVNYIGLIALLVSEIQELKKKLP